MASEEHTQHMSPNVPPDLTPTVPPFVSSFHQHVRLFDDEIDALRQETHRIAETAQTFLQATDRYPHVLNFFGQSFNELTVPEQTSIKTHAKHAERNSHTFLAWWMKTFTEDVRHNILAKFGVLLSAWAEQNNRSLDDSFLQGFQANYENGVDTKDSEQLSQMMKLAIFETYLEHEHNTHTPKS